jgi:hypothetical protein
MRTLVLRDPNIKRFFNEYPSYITAYVYEYTPEEFMDTFGDEIGYVDYWEWAYGPDIVKELFYIQEGDHFKVLPYVSKSGSASYGEDDPEPVGDVDVLKNLLKDYKGLVIYVMYRKERGGERYQRMVIYSYLY